MHHFAGPEDLAACRVGFDGSPTCVWNEGTRAVVVLDRHDHALVTVADLDKRGGAGPHTVGLLGNAVEHRLNIEPGGADCFEHVSHRALAFKRGVEIVEQLGVGDSNRRMVGEDLDDASVARIEWANLGSCQHEEAVRCAVYRQRGLNHTSGHASCLSPHEFLHVVDELRSLLRPESLLACCARPVDEVAKFVGKRCGEHEIVTVPPNYGRPVGVTHPSGLGDDALKHGSKITRMRAY